MATAPQPGRSSGTGLNQNLAAALSYVAGFVSGVVVLMMEKENAYVRFHAMQSTITFLAVVVGAVLVSNVPVIGRFLYPLFVLGVAVLWLILMAKALNGERYKLPYVGDMAEKQVK